MTRRIWMPLFVLLALAACATGRLELVQALSPEAKEDFAKYRQFLTESQQDEYLAMKSDDARKAFLANLKIEERLAKYPREIQSAIWSQEVVKGMDREAVLLTWGSPIVREVDENAKANGQDVDRWTYRRNDRYVEVVLTRGVVTALNQAAH